MFCNMYTNAIDIAFRIWNHRKAGHSNSPSLDSRQIGVYSKYFIWDVTKVFYFRRDHIYLPICGCVALKHYIPICDHVFVELIWDMTRYLETLYQFVVMKVWNVIPIPDHAALIHYANLGECTFAAKLLFMNMGSVCLVRSPFLLLVLGHT